MTFEELGIKGYKAGTKSIITCPVCSHNRKPQNRNKKCLTINDVEGNRWYKCNHPGCKGGDDGGSFRGNLDVMGKYDEIKKIANLPSKKNASIFSQPILDWLKRKGLNVSTAIECDVYEDLNSFGDDKGGVIKIPTKIHGMITQVKFRKVIKGCSSPREWFLSEKIILKANGIKIELELDEPDWVTNIRKSATNLTRLMLGLDRVELDRYENDKPLVAYICEGETDMMTLHQCNYKNVLAVPDGAPSENATHFDTKFNYLKDPYTISVLQAMDIIVVLGDNDPAGTQLNRYFVKYAMQFAKIPLDRFRMVKHPNGYNDINEIYQGDQDKNLFPLGVSGLKIMFEAMSSIPIKGVYRALDIKPDLDKIRKKGFQKGYTTGIKFMDEYISYREKTLILTSGPAKAGKTTYNRFAYIKLLLNNPKLKLAFFTPEMRPSAREMAKMMETFLNLSIEEDNHFAMSAEQYERAMMWVHERIFIINPDELNMESFGGVITDKDTRKLKTILKYVSYLNKTEGLFGFVIDAYSNLETDDDIAKMPETKIIQRQLEEVHKFINRENLLADIIVHPRKITTLPSGNRKPMNVDDLDGSAHWVNKADIIRIVERDEYVTAGEKDSNGNLLYFISKNLPTRIKYVAMKFEELGKVGIADIQQFGFGQFQEFTKKQNDKLIDEIEKKKNGGKEAPGMIDSDKPMIPIKVEKPTIPTLPF